MNSNLNSRRELTREISSALQNVNHQTIKRALKIAKVHPTVSTKASLIQAFEEAVMRYGIGEFVSKMNRRLMKQTCKALQIADVRQKTLIDAIHRMGIVEFLANHCDVMLLKEYSRILGLSSDPNEHFCEKGSQEIEREIADEVMLQGTERFFRRMPLDLVNVRQLSLSLSSSSHQFFSSLLSFFSHITHYYKMLTIDSIHITFSLLITLFFHP
jgi:hypothetical protein